MEDFSEHAFVYRLLGMFGKSDDERLPKQQTDYRFPICKLIKAGYESAETPHTGLIIHCIHYVPVILISFPGFPLPEFLSPEFQRLDFPVQESQKLLKQG